jgi:hypothetical protein
MPRSKDSPLAVPGSAARVRRTSVLACCAWVLAVSAGLGLLPVSAAVVVGPWLAGDGTTNVDVLVECDSAAAMTVSYGLGTSYGGSAVTTASYPATNGPDVIQRIKLTGLQPNSTYHYRLSGQGAGPADYTLKTGPDGKAGVALAEVPSAVSNRVGSVANGRVIEKLERVAQLDGPHFLAWIADTLGPELLIVAENGGWIDQAVVVPFGDLPEVVRTAARSAVSGRLQVCRRSLYRAEATYVVDYIIQEEEPVYALIRGSDGWVRGSYGYLQDDPD